MPGAVDVRLKGDAVLIELTQLGQRHDLETAGIRQDRKGPSHEVVQAAKPRDALGARAQHQMINIAEQNIGARRAHIFNEHRFHCRRCPDRHESGRADDAARRIDLAPARGPVGRPDHESESWSHLRPSLAPSTAIFTTL